MLKVVADENMPLLAEFFSDIAEIKTLPGRSIKNDDLRDADALLVRSVTKVTPNLLAGSRVSFVGTATIGTDHIDLAGLNALSIPVVSAPGCNARAVGEYVATALMSLSEEQGWQPSGRTLGVVGLGNTGSWVVKLATLLGFRVLGCDPHVSLAGVASSTFADVLKKADILSFHVPLRHDGEYSTWHLLGESEINALPKGAVIINSSRGDVVDNNALLKRLQAKGDITAVLDVWEGEPLVMPDLLAQVRWGSPHVAGYSQEGKWRGTEAIYRAFCRHFNLPAKVSLASLGLEQPLEPFSVAGDSSVAAVLQRACPLQRDDAALRVSVLEANPGLAFDLLRRHYPTRREFTAHQLVVADDHSAKKTLSALGFNLLIRSKS